MVRHSVSDLTECHWFFGESVRFGAGMEVAANDNQ
jgi:hypothetical protein